MSNFKAGNYYAISFYTEDYYKNHKDFDSLLSNSILLNNNLGSSLFLDIGHCDKSGYFQCHLNNTITIGVDIHDSRYYTDDLFNYAMIREVNNKPSKLGWVNCSTNIPKHENNNSANEVTTHFCRPIIKQLFSSTYYCCYLCDKDM